MKRLVPLLFIVPSVAATLPIEPDAVFVRVIDSGAGLATVVRMPGDHYMIYAAGHWNGQGSRSFNAFAQVIPANEEIDLLVLSHSDADHQGAVGRIFDQWTVKTVIHQGLLLRSEKPLATWLKREHQRTSPAVLPKRDGLVENPPEQIECCCTPAQRETTKDIRL